MYRGSVHAEAAGTAAAALAPAASKEWAGPAARAAAYPSKHVPPAKLAWHAATVGPKLRQPVVVSTNDEWVVAGGRGRVEGWGAGDAKARHSGHKGAGARAA